MGWQSKELLTNKAFVKGPKKWISDCFLSVFWQRNGHFLLTWWYMATPFPSWHSKTTRATFELKLAILIWYDCHIALRQVVTWRHPRDGLDPGQRQPSHDCHGRDPRQSSEARNGKLRLCLTQSLSPVYHLYSIRVAKVENGWGGFWLKVLKNVLNQRLGKNCAWWMMGHQVDW